jgi:hypothetical protein
MGVKLGQLHQHTQNILEQCLGETIWTENGEVIECLGKSHYKNFITCILQDN